MDTQESSEALSTGDYRYQPNHDSNTGNKSNANVTTEVISNVEIISSPCAADKKNTNNNNNNMNNNNNSAGITPQNQIRTENAAKSSNHKSTETEMDLQSRYSLCSTNAQSFSASPRMDILATNHQKRLRWRQLRIFSGSANTALAKEITDTLNVKLSAMSINQFADGEIGIRIQENVRGKDIFIIQPTCPTSKNSVNDNLMELILSITTFRRSSASSITAVIPYYGYARQDRKTRSRVPISAADVARLLECAGVDRVVAVDLHCGQIQGFFAPRTPSDNLNGSIVALPYFLNLGLDGANTVVVSPDAGGVARSKEFRQGLHALGLQCGFAMIIKQREKSNQISQMDLVGDVRDRDCIIVDDMIDTAGTLCKAGRELKLKGANRIFAFATHGLFCGPAVDRITASEFEKVVVCNTIPMRKSALECKKIVVVSVAQLIAKAIYCIHFKKSVSKLFDIEHCGGKLPHQRPVTDDHHVSHADDEY